MNKENMMKVTLRIPKGLKKRLDRLVLENQVEFPTQSQAVRVALDRLLKEHEL